MTKVNFSKYQGTGNDFICIDNRDGALSLTTDQIKRLCQRRFGIGADGLILLEQEEGFDFRMVYYNADGRESTMCGNGGRCITLFAKDLGVEQQSFSFIAADGEHEAVFRSEDEIRLRMKDVHSIDKKSDGWFIDTGSPHYMAYVIDLEKIDLIKEAWNIRYSDQYREDGVNVNFICLNDKEKGLTLRTYERGVENETLSCGTGVTAAALVSFEAGKISNTSVDVHTEGGDLKVDFKPTSKGGYEDIWLVGPARYVYAGSVEI